MPTPAFQLMAVVNVTPDSFSDGGTHADAGAAIAHGLRLHAEGAEIIDVGGESTRPGAVPVHVDEELRRVIPAIEGLAAGAPTAVLSIDTTKATVARAALDAGATYVNDVSALRHDPAMAALVAERGATVCLMHMRGRPETMQQRPEYAQVVDEVVAFLEERLADAVAAGIREDRIQLDPGIGFGKGLQHNLELLHGIDRIVAIGRPVVIGTSRKSFIGKLAGGAAIDDPGARLPGSLATNVLALAGGASIFRVHDVAATRQALTAAAAVLSA